MICISGVFVFGSSSFLSSPFFWSSFLASPFRSSPFFLSPFPFFLSSSFLSSLTHQKKWAHGWQPQHLATGSNEDFGRGLMKVANKEDVKVAGAAALSLAAANQIGPTPVPAKNVTVTETEAGWTVQFRQQFLTGEAAFGKDGKLVRLAKQSNLPPPPQIAVPSPNPPK